MSAPMQDKISKIASRAVPAIGLASYGLFSVNIMDPELFRSLLSPAHVEIANSLWFNAHIGIGVYLYNRGHMKKAPTYNRIMYSAFGSFVFNFGSVLFWATLKALLPDNRPGKVMFGLGSSMAFLAIGREYMKFVDNEEEVD